MNRFSKVELFDTSNNHSQEFTAEHARKILKACSGWILPENSPYQYDSSNGITIKSNTGDNKEPIKEKRNTKGSKASKQA